jgi:hypothetical protein
MLTYVTYGCCYQHNARNLNYEVPFVAVYGTHSYAAQDCALYGTRRRKLKSTS